MNPLLCTDYAKRRVIEEVMAIRGRGLEQPDRLALRRQLEAMTLEQAAAVRDRLLEGMDAP